jgi:predicted CXXCH cytochrome family protein
VDCHEDIHKNALQAKYYPEQNCSKCHVTESWTAAGFDHSVTSFKLEGAHNRVSCGACHKPDEATQTKVVFAPIGTQCATCHENVHGRQFEKNGSTNCRSCHGVEKWKEVKFDHNRAAFKLDGKHAQVSCAGCHKKALVDGQYVVQYKFESFECIVCHK